MKMIKLGELADIRISNVDKKSKPGETPVCLCNFTDVYNNWAITSSHLHDLMKATANDQQIEKFSLQKGDVVITKDSETRDDIGMSAYIADDFSNVVLGYHCALIRPKKDLLNGKYLNAFLNSSTARKYFSNFASGSGQRYTLIDSSIKDIMIPVIPLEEQEKIGNVFSHIDAKIENNNIIIHSLEEMAHTIYDYWFLQFEFPNSDGKPYKSSGGKMVWNQTIKKEIPVFWKIRKIRDCIDHINTGLNPRDNFVLNNGNIRYITVKNITTTGTIDFAGCDTINEETKRLINRRSMVSKGDILFASIAPLGRCFLVEETPDDWEINESIFSIRPKSNMVSPEYLFMVFMSDSFVKKAEHSSTGSIFSGIRISTLEDMDIVVPDKNTMEKLSSVVAPIYLKKYFCSKENEKLHNERNYLLPLLISGQVQIG